MSVLDVVTAVLTGLIAGAYAGLLGVGGGILMVPAMVLLLDQSQHVAAGTSLLVIVPTALAGSAANVRRSLLDVRTSVSVGAVGAVGAVAGSIVALDVLGEEALRRVFGVFLIGVAALVQIRGRRRRSEP